VPDKFNRYLRSSPEGVNAAIRQISTLHVIDEARHISLAGHTLKAALAESGVARRAVYSAAARLLLAQLARAFYAPPARFYELAGLERGARWRAAALRNPARRRFVAERLAPTVRMLEAFGLAIDR
jgi:hypothetical protein